jgi:hypothetical protein
MLPPLAQLWWSVPVDKARRAPSVKQTDKLQADVLSAPELMTEHVVDPAVATGDERDSSVPEARQLASANYPLATLITVIRNVVL